VAEDGIEPPTRGFSKRPEASKISRNPSQAAEIIEISATPT